MYKVFILFLGFFLLASCNNTTKNPVSETKTETTKTETQKQEVTTIITPFAGIELASENEEDVKGISFGIYNKIIPQKDKESLYKAYGYENEFLKNLQDADQKNADFLRSHKEKILENFPGFKNNPTTEKNPENIEIHTEVFYKLLNDMYYPNSLNEKKINTEKTQLLIGLKQNYNHNYTGSLWDLPLASLDYDWKIEAEQLATKILIARINQDAPLGLLNITKTSDASSNNLLQVGVNTTDNTYTKIPDKIIYNLDSIKPIFDLIKLKPNTENSFIISNILPKTHEVSDIIYEN